MGKLYCYYCDSDVGYEELEKEVTSNIKGVDIVYVAKIAICKECGHEIDMPDWDDDNIHNAHIEYRKKIGLITIDEINELMIKYNIGKKPLSTLLGWSESTIDRYFNGVVPLKAYSDELIKLRNPKHMLYILDKNKGKITDIAYKKVKIALDDLLGYKEKKIIDVFNVAKFFQSKIDDEAGSSITPLKMQKLVYYGQAWHLAFFGTPLFDSELQAWIHGPVSPTIYHKYQEYKYRNIDRNDFDFHGIFDDEQIELLSEVYNIYGSFDGKVLEKMSHKDDPWKEARRECEDDENSQEIITNDSMKNYFVMFRHMFDIDHIDEIKKSLKVYQYILPI